MKSYFFLFPQPGLGMPETYCLFEHLRGGSCRIRTCDQLIKSQLLYQLS